MQRVRWVRLIIGSAVVAAAATLTAIKFGGWELARLTARVDQLEQERQKLIEYAERLSASRRVAQVNVLGQTRNDLGKTVTLLQWQEIAADRTLGRPLSLDVLGEQVYFEAWVIKFAHGKVASGDDLRGASVALFRRVFGDEQAPETGPEVDRTTRPPGGMGSPADKFQQELWAKFWDLIDSPKLAAQYGVRVAQCEAPAVVVRPGQVWEVALDAAGGLNLKKISQ